MTDSGASLTPTSLLAEAAGVLQEGGYRHIAEGFPDWHTSTVRLFEDKYNVVGLCVFPTCADLLDSWRDLQAALVQLISARVGQGEAKAWDGYLLLATPGIAPSGSTEIEELRHDTSRLRKLVATGENLQSLSDVARFLKPLLPLTEPAAEVSSGSALDDLPALLASKGIPEDTTRVLVRAFEKQEPLVESLHQHREEGS